MEHHPKNVALRPERRQKHARAHRLGGLARPTRGPP